MSDARDRAELVELTGVALDAANAVYRGLGFWESTPPADRTFGVLQDGAPWALGRITSHGDDAEIGGFWVREDRRGSGRGRALVADVVRRVPADARLWCVAYGHLASFYKSFGLRDVRENESIPIAVRRKWHDCHGPGVRVTLLVRDPA